MTHPTHWKITDHQKIASMLLLGGVSSDILNMVSKVEKGKFVLFPILLSKENLNSYYIAIVTFEERLIVHLINDYSFFEKKCLELGFDIDFVNRYVNRFLSLSDNCEHPIFHFNLIKSNVMYPKLTFEKVLSVMTQKIPKPNWWYFLKLIESVHPHLKSRIESFINENGLVFESDKGIGRIMFENPNLLNDVFSVSYMKNKSLLK